MSRIYVRPKEEGYEILGAFDEEDLQEYPGASSIVLEGMDVKATYKALGKRFALKDLPKNFTRLLRNGGEMKTQWNQVEGYIHASTPGVLK